MTGKNHQQPSAEGKGGEKIEKQIRSAHAKTPPVGATERIRLGNEPRINESSALMGIALLFGVFLLVPFVMFVGQGSA